MILLQDQKLHNFSVLSDHMDQSHQGCITSHSEHTLLCEYKIRLYIDKLSHLNTDYLSREVLLPALQRLVLNSGTGIQSSMFGSYISPQLRSSEWPFDPPTTKSWPQTKSERLAFLPFSSYEKKPNMDCFFLKRSALTISTAI